MGEARNVRWALFKVGAMKMKVRLLPGVTPLKRYQSTPKESARSRFSKARAGL
jgi:bacteriorhodopsin